jgi:hypothetical protein
MIFLFIILIFILLADWYLGDFVVVKSIWNLIRKVVRGKDEE